jgi:hypothetical protein
MAENKSMENAKRQLAANEEAQEKAREKDVKVAEDVKPTPTQEENDLARLGAHLTEHEPDGSPVQDPHAAQHNKQSTAHPASGGGYSTREARPASRPATPQSSS